MFGALWTFVRNHIVDEVPDEMSACLECRDLDCRDSRYETCPNRLQRAAALRTMRSFHDDATPAAHGT